MRIWVSAMIAFLLLLFFEYIYIYKLSKLRLFKRKEYIDANKKTCINELHKKKSKIPTMGGLAMAMSFLIVVIIDGIIQQQISYISLLLLLFALLGMIDDFIKIKKIRDGISAKEKLVGLSVVSSIILVVLLIQGNLLQELAVPFTETRLLLPIPVVFCISLLFIVAASNSVNLTDGIDGLALGICSIIFLAIAFIAWKMGEEEVERQAVVLFVICIGMLVYNHYPAKVFMGDTGSLFLGGAIGVLCVELNHLLWIPILLAVCIWEVISVVIQLTSMRFRNKKVFLIAPYHHHLEKKGWSERRIDYTFWTVSVGLAIVAIIA